MTTFQAPFFCTFWYQSLSENRKLIISGLLIVHSRKYLVQNQPLLIQYIVVPSENLQFSWYTSF